MDDPGDVRYPVDVRSVEELKAALSACPEWAQRVFRAKFTGELLAYRRAQRAARAFTKAEA